MKLFLKRSDRSGTLFLTSQTYDEKPRAVGIVFSRNEGDGYGWKAGNLRDDIPYATEESALEAMYAALNFTF